MANSLLVVIYLRVSTEEQAKRGFSIPEQRESCLQRAQEIAAAEQRRTGLPVDLQTVEFLDSVSGEILDRPELERVRAFIAQNRPAYFVCLDPDRFSRTTHHAILIANEIEAAGTNLEFVQHDYQTTPEGRLFFTLRVAIAQYEKSKIKERSLRGKRGKMKNGELPIGLNMFGYAYDTKTQEVTPHPEEAAWVKQIFLWASQGLGRQLIADRLNAAGVATKRGAPKWYRATVSKILRNRGYIGEFQVNRYDTEGLGIERQLPAGRRTRSITPTIRPEAEWITIPIPPLVSEELWQQVQERRQVAAEHPPKRNGLLSGLMRCGYCGAPIYYRPHATLGNVILCSNRYPYMRDLKNPEPVCKRLPHRAVTPIEDHVWDQICTWLTEPELITAYVQGTQTEQEQPDLAQSLRDELEVLQRQLRQKQDEQVRMMRLVASGRVDPEVVAAELEPHAEQIDYLRSSITTLRERIDQAVMSQAEQERTLARFRAVREEIAGATGNIRAKLSALDLPHRQALVRQLVDRVIVYRQGCEIRAVP